jgi:hypothetical protein
MDTLMWLAAAAIWTVLVFNFGMSLGKAVAMTQAKEVMAETFTKVDTILKTHGLKLKVEER